MTGSGKAGYDQTLYRLVVPEMYQHNGFRVAGLPTTATAEEIRRHGRTATDDWVREACRRLDDPVHRIVDEFFWLWPDEPDDDRAVAVHNSAVRGHAAALDKILDLPGWEVDWFEVHEGWRTVATTDACWAYLRARIRRLDQPEVDVRLADDLRRLLPALMLSVNAELVVRAIVADDPAAVATAWDAGFGETRLAEDELLRAIEPLCAELAREYRDFQLDAEIRPEQVGARADKLTARTRRLARLLSAVPTAPNALRDAISGSFDTFVRSDASADQMAWQAVELMRLVRDATRDDDERAVVDGDLGRVLVFHIASLCRTAADRLVYADPDDSLLIGSRLLDDSRRSLELLASLPSPPPAEPDKSHDAVAILVTRAMAVPVLTDAAAELATECARRALDTARSPHVRAIVSVAGSVDSMQTWHKTCYICCARPSVDRHGRAVELRRGNSSARVLIPRCGWCRIGRFGLPLLWLGCYAAIGVGLTALLGVLFGEAGALVGVVVTFGLAGTFGGPLVHLLADQPSRFATYPELLRLRDAGWEPQ